MRTAIQYVQDLSVEDAVSLGFDSFEVRYEDIEESEETEGSMSNVSKELSEKIADSGGKIIGIVVNGLKATSKAEVMKSCIDKAAAYGASYVIVDTRGIETLCGLSEILSEILEHAIGAGIKIYIENGYVCRGGVHYHSEGSNAVVLCSVVEELNKRVKNSSQFGICINVGYANLLGINIRQFITECGKYLGIMHMSDNNGISDQQQMPYTFTTGRGINSTDWYHIIGALYKLKFEGNIVFDTVGTFKRTPPELHKAMLELLAGIYGEWVDCFNIEKRLGEHGKKIILFGAGKMAENYMDAFGEKYPPVFLVDNNSKTWGTERLGFEVKNPEVILEIPEDQRSVWICNMYYDAIGLQLDRMGIQYNCYFDHYYL